MTREGHRLFLVFSSIVCLAGCHSAPIAEYAKFAEPANSYVPASGSENAFDLYAQTADSVERVAGKHLTRVWFTPGQKQDAQKLLEPYVHKVEAAERHACNFQFSPKGPFDRTRYQRGWRLIGWCFYWDIQDACAAGDFDKAVRTTVLATRFGFDLTGGGAVDASTGLHIVDDARKALAYYLGRLSPSQLRALEEGVKAAINGKPPISQTISNERSDTMQAIQTLQEQYRDGKLDRFVDEFGSDVREPISYLKDLQPTDPKRAQFFKSFADYADENVAYAKKLAETPAIGRDKVVKPVMPTDHPWRRLAKYFVHAPIPLIKLNDITTARTRLLIIEAELTRRQKLHMGLPNDLSGFLPSITIDPYTGNPMIYVSDHVDDYKVYSVGADCVDNGGQTDSAFLQPDLKLERPIP